MSRSYEPGHSVGMLAAVEHGPILCSDSNILCLSWKGRVPKSEKDKPVCRRRYYEEGWLATGNGRGVVVLVRWNEPFQKLATCDMEGGIFVWIQYEGRWSALIAYRDGFVLVGSVSGQRHWSSEINLESQITCGIWTPDDQQSDGIVSMSWNCPDFLVEDSTESDTDSDDNVLPLVRSIKPLLTVSFLLSGDISLMNNYDDLSPAIIRSGLKDVEVQWCSQGDLLAVAGMERHSADTESACAPVARNALVKFYNVQGEHIYTLETPAQRPITTICWGHRDSRLFLACGPALYVVRVEHRVASLQLLCQQGIASALREERDVGKLNMPSLLCSYVTTAFIPTIKPPIPDPNNIRDFVSYPTAGNERLHCTMKRAEDNPEAGGPCYTLYLEHLGGLVCVNPMISYTDSCNGSDSSDIELTDEWVGKKSPKLSRGNRSPKRFSLTRREFCMDGITEHNYLAQVTSNIWGTKFKIVGLASFLPANLGAVIYKTSLLHLQPRQMTIYLPEVRKISLDFMSLPVFNPNVFSEDEDDLPVMGPSGVAGDNPPCTVNIPIAPIHSPAQAMSPTQSIGLVQSLLANQNIQLDVLTNPTATAAAAAAIPPADRSGHSDSVAAASYPMPPPLPATESGLDRAEQHGHGSKPGLPRSLPPAHSFMDVDGSVEIQMRKMNPPPPYPGTATLITNCDSPSVLAPDPCLKKDEFLLHPGVTLQYPTPLGYERITTFDSSGNVEEVCRPRRRLIRNQKTYALQGISGSATLKVTSSDSKKIQLPYSSATLSRLSVPRYSIPSGDPPPYPDPANQVPAALPPPQRIDNTLIHATLRRDRRDLGSLKVPQMMESSRTLPTKSKSTSPLTSQSSQYSLLGPVDNSRDRTVYVNSAFTEDEAVNQQCHLEKSVRHLTLGDVGLMVKRPPPYQWDPSSSSSTASSSAEQFWLSPEQTMLAPPPAPHKPPPLLFSQAQHLDMARLPFVFTTKPPNSPSTSTLTFPSGYQISLSPFPPGMTGHSGSTLQTLQSTSQQSEAIGSVPFGQQGASLVLPPGYPSSLANLACCPLPPMYPGSSSCAGLQLHPMNLHPWNPYPCPPPPPMQDPPSHPAPPLPTKTHQKLEKPILSPPPPAMPPPPPPLPPPPPPTEPPPPPKITTDDLAESANNFLEPPSLNESPVPRESERVSKKSRKRLDSRAEETNMPAVSEGGKGRKEGRALSDFNSLISSPRLGGRDKKKPKSQREQLNKGKKMMSRTTNEFQDSSESEPELFISGDELMNQNQSSKKSWKNKRSLRMASELEEIKCRKANEREDRSLGSQGFVYVMANKQPLWNEATQVYQLDFGGRVTQESAKNFQIELDGRQVMQFGRIDGNAYILDFQYPFSAVQAFAVALANVTQRLK
ncbi:hypothetical protein CRUP_038033 [Coryphaenoides rupestris]|nr:hypothetical protein CRUP_038033 [Coryphaenoides rupestris]